MDYGRLDRLDQVYRRKKTGAKATAARDALRTAGLIITVNPWLPNRDAGFRCSEDACPYSEWSVAGNGAVRWFRCCRIREWGFHMAGNEDGKDVFLSVSQVATRLNVSKMTIYRMIHTGEMPAVLIGHTYRIRETALARYLEHGVIAPGIAGPVGSGSNSFQGGYRGEDTV